MTNEARSSKAEGRHRFVRASSFFRTSFLRHFRISSFVIPPSFQLRWLLLIVTGLFALSGASCPQMLRQYTNPLPRVLPPSPTLEQVIEVVNRNSSQIHSFSTNHASISGTGFPVADGERRLRAAAAIPSAGGHRLPAPSSTWAATTSCSGSGCDASQPPADLLLPPRPVRRQPGAADDAVRAAVADRGVGGGGIRSAPCRTR